MNSNNITEFNSARTYGLLGMILEFIGPMTDILLHGFGFIISVIGLILILIALKEISDYYNDKRPYRYMIYSVVSGIVMGVIGVFVLIIFIGWFLDTSTNIGSPITGTSTFTGVPFIVMLLAFFGIIVLGLIISVIFQYLAYKSVYELTGIDHFNTGAMLLLIGAILIIIAVGIFIIFAGIII